MKKSIAGLFVLGLAALGILLFWVSFRTISSQSTVNSEVAASRGNAEVPLDPASLSTPSLVVEGDGSLEKAVRSEFARLSRDQSGPVQVKLLDTLADAANSPIVVVTVKQQSGFWTPFYSRSNLEVEVAYASDGDLSFRGSEPVQFRTTEDQPSIRYAGHYSAADVSWGIMSLPGYRDFLAHQIASIVLTSLQDQVKS